MEVEERLRAVLLGTALGDALGLPAEGMHPKAISRRWGVVDDYHLVGRTGYVSDDTEQSALVAEALIRHPGDPEACAAAFARALVGWFFRLPFGVGLATVRACLRSAVGLRPSGVRSAGNGAAMRAGVLGVFFAEDPELRREFGRALARVTHMDERAVDGALYVAELAALCSRAGANADRLTLAWNGLAVVTNEPFRQSLERALTLAAEGVGIGDAAELGTSGFVLHTVPFAAFCFVRFGDDVLPALSTTLSAGGDADTIAAILGGWLGALHGEAALPASLVSRIHDGPFGPTHLRGLARGLAEGGPVPRYAPVLALGRNLALYPVVIGHGLRRLLP